MAFWDTSQNQLLTAFIEYAYNRVWFARKKAALHKWISMIGSPKEHAGTGDEEPCLLVTRGQHLPTSHDCSDRTMQISFQIRRRKVLSTCFRDKNGF